MERLLPSGRGIRKDCFGFPISDHSSRYYALMLNFFVIIKAFLDPIERIGQFLSGMTRDGI